MSFFGNVDFQKLTYTERTCYSYLRDNVDKIPYMRVRDIALEAHVGTSSVMRLIHKMGYDSYTDFGILPSAFLHSISTFSPW